MPSGISSSPIIFICLLACALTTPTFSAETPLTLAQAQQIALERSRLLVAQDLSVRSSHEMAMAAGHFPDPVLKMGVDNLPVNRSERFSLGEDFMTMRRVGIMQEITRADKLQARAEQYQRVAEKSRAEKDFTIATIQRDTAIAWLDRYFAEQMVTVITEQIAQSRLEIQAAESAYRAGRGNQSDIYSARSSLVLIEDRASEIQQRVRNAKVALTRWIGNAADETLADQPAMETIQLNPDLLETEMEHHPQIAVLDKQVNIAKAGAKIAQANKSADWSIELAYQQRGSAYSDMISVGISVPLQWDQKNRQDRELYAKLIEVDIASAQRDEQLRQHVADIRALINEWQNNRQRYTRFESELIPLANERIQAVIGAYRGGKASLSDLLAARRNQIDMRLQSLQLQSDTARLWAQINFLVPMNLGEM